MVVGVSYFLAFFLIMTPLGKTVVGKLGYKSPVTYEDCRDMIAHRDTYLREIQQVSKHFTLDKGHCDPVDKPSI